MEESQHFSCVFWRVGWKRRMITGRDARRRKLSRKICFSRLSSKGVDWNKQVCVFFVKKRKGKKKKMCVYKCVSVCMYIY